MPETDTDRGEPAVYEITWESGHVERISAHQVAWPGNTSFLSANPGPSRITFHAYVEGRWTLMLQAREADIRTVRNVTTEAAVSSAVPGEPTEGGAREMPELVKLPADGTIVGALTKSGRTLHAGRVNHVDELAAYSMSPQCLRYRKADGTRLAAHTRGDYPMLVRRLDRPFTEYVAGSGQWHTWRLCPFCVSVVLGRSPSGVVPAPGQDGGS